MKYSIAVENTALYRSLYKSLKNIVHIREISTLIEIPSLKTSYIRGFVLNSHNFFDTVMLTNYERLFLLTQQPPSYHHVVLRPPVELFGVLKDIHALTFADVTFAWLPGILHNMKYAPLGSEECNTDDIYRLNANLVKRALEAVTADMVWHSEAALEARDMIFRIAEGRAQIDGTIQECYYQSVYRLEQHFAKAGRDKANAGT